jgi:hypothetical protein
VGPRPGRLDQRARLDRVGVRDDGIRRASGPSGCALPRPGATIAAWIDLDHLAATGELVFRNVDDREEPPDRRDVALRRVICWLLHFHRLVGGALHTERQRDRRRRRTQHRQEPVREDPLHRRAARPAPRRASGSPASAAPVLAALEPGPGEDREPRSTAPSSTARARRTPVPRSTLDYALVDEAAFVRHGELVHAAIDDACPNGKAYLSTVNGDDNVHARIATRAEGLDVPAPALVDASRLQRRPARRRAPRSTSTERSAAGSRSLEAAGAEDCRSARACSPGSSGRRGSRARTATPGKLTSPWYDAARDRQDRRAGRPRARHRPRGALWAASTRVPDRPARRRGRHPVRPALPSSSPGTSASTHRVVVCRTRRTSCA